VASLIRLTTWGVVEIDEGNDARARSLQETSLALHRKLGDKRGITRALNELGAVDIKHGDDARARVWLTESVALHQELGLTREVADCLESLAQAMARAHCLTEECNPCGLLPHEISYRGCLITDVSGRRGRPCVSTQTRSGLPPDTGPPQPKRGSRGAPLGPAQPDRGRGPARVAARCRTGRSKPTCVPARVGRH